MPSFHTDLIPVILGPTASGKTKIGIGVARQIDGEIVSVDSRKIYQDLPIGTAAPAGRMEGKTLIADGVPHHLIGTLPPEQVFTAGDFAREATRLIAEIRQRDRRPLLVGGTGFYFKALRHGLPPLPQRDAGVRHDIEECLRNDGPAALHRALADADPVAAQHIHPADRQKLIRALEVIRLTGQPFSTWRNTQPADADPNGFRFLVIGVDFVDDVLQERIAARSAAMVERGMIEETARLLKRGVPPEAPALASFGYKDAVRVLQGDIPRAAFLPLLIKGTRAYAKRQRTWLRTQTPPDHRFVFDRASRTEDAVSAITALL